MMEVTATGISKSYGSVVALTDAMLTLRGGEIHAIMGENGSGKSTLLSIISGAQPPDAGTIVVDGKPYGSLDPRLARSLGIAFVPQEPQLATALSVGENIMLGRWPKARGIIAWRELHRTAQGLLDTLGIAIRSTALVSALSTGRRQLVEIAKSLVERPRFLLLDEATSSLDEADVGTLFRSLLQLREQGVGIGFVSHRISEIMRLADQATILRDGRYVGTLPLAEADEHRLVSMMVGRDLDNYWHKVRVAPGTIALEAAGLHRGALRDISITVREGEIVGLAGLVGSGRSSLMRTLMGVKPAVAGTISVNGKPVRIASPRHAHRLGLAYVPEDRKSEGLVMGWSIARNAALSIMNERRPLSLLGRRFDHDAFTRGSRGLKIRSSGPGQIVRELSGGNQQKVLIARELATDPRILLLDEPTRGVDVGAKEDIYAEIAALVSKGMALLIASSELPELLGVCDRIYVMFGSRIVAELTAAEATEEAITYWASGGHEVVSRQAESA